MDSIHVEEISGIINYLKTIDWSEPWLIVLMIVQASLTIITILTRNYGNFQAIFFFVLLMLVYFSENINEVAAKHWRYFSQQQYFDSKGLFISLIFSIPLLINCLLMVCNWLYMSGTLMVKLKRAQLRERLRSTNSLDERSAATSSEKRSKKD